MDIEFYQAHLNRVSRSFAFCIAELKAPLRQWVSLNYLVCRILDTVEDAPWESDEAQLEQFQKFDEFLRRRPEDAELNSWRAQFPQDIPSGEKDLLQQADLVFSDFHALGEAEKQALLVSIESMSRGMQHFVRKKQGGPLRLRQLTEVNQYCFFVAGVVGESLAKLLTLVEPEFALTQDKILKSHHFGLFLQKVNLLKDQAGDQLEGRHLVSSRREVFFSLLENADNAFAFLESVPKKQKGFRLFCAWSLFLGLASLPWSERSFQQGKVGKIPRLKAKSLLNKVEKRIDSSSELSALFKEHWAKVEEVLEGVSSPGSSSNEEVSQGACDWIKQAYLGPLKSDEWAHLGML